MKECKASMSYQLTIDAVRHALKDAFAEVDSWFDRPEHVRRHVPGSGGWSVEQILEHITLTNHFLLLVIRRWSEKALRKAERGEPLPEGESDLARLEVIGQRGSFRWMRPEHMEPTGVPSTPEVRDRMRDQERECQELLERMGKGEGALCRVSMSVAALGKIDLYQWLYFLAQHARRHLHQLQEIEQELRRHPPG